MAGQFANLPEAIGRALGVMPSQVTRNTTLTVTDRELARQAIAVGEALNEIGAVAPTYLRDAVAAQVSAVSALIVEELLFSPDIWNNLGFMATRSPQQRAAANKFSAITDKLQNAPEGSPLAEADLSALVTLLAASSTKAAGDLSSLLLALRRAQTMLGEAIDLADADAAERLDTRLSLLVGQLRPYFTAGMVEPPAVIRIGKSVQSVAKAALFAAERRTKSEHAKATGEESRFLTEIVNAFGITTLRMIGTGSVTDIELQRAALLVDYIGDKIARPLILAVSRKAGSYRREVVEEFIESTFTDLAEAMRTAGEKPSASHTEALQRQIVIFEKAWRKFGGGSFGTLTPRQLLLRSAVENLVVHTIRFVERPRATETDTLAVLLSETLDKAADLGFGDVDTLVDDLVDDVALPAVAIR